MNPESAVQVKDQKDKRCLPPDKVLNLEKKLWGLIHSKGLLHSDVKELYKKACSIYEEFILSDLELEKLQEVEYSLWKLHYKHIDEFRKQLRGSSVGAENTKSGRQHNVASESNYSEGFRSFLLEATIFYQNLIMKIKICHGLSGDPFFSTRGGIYSLVVPVKMHNCRFLCHRLFICLGDLARYKELHEKPDIINCKWSVVVANYVKAAMLWPNGGNPQNQLALLATYIGDEFLALYHCIRSLAVEEPFPDAWGNLVILFEKNKASSLPSDSSSEVCFDFSRPSAKVIRKIKIQASGASSNCKSFEGHEHPVHREATLSSVFFVRMIRSFLTATSWEDLQNICACTVAELEVLLDLDDSNLNLSLDSYWQLDPARVGPFKSLQLVSILIFTIQNLTQVTGQKESEARQDTQQPGLTQLLLTVTFICMGRLVSRCSNSNPMHPSPLLPAILVFVEWLVSKVNEAGIFGTEDEISTKGLSYFFGCFVELLNQITNEVGQAQCANNTALWEDFELQGFTPLAHAHTSIDFTSHWENSNDYVNGKEFRSHRIICAAKKIAGRSVSSRKWLLWDDQERQFCLAESRSFTDKCELDVASPLPDPNTDDSHQSHKSTDECKRTNLKVNRESSDVLGKAVLGEEEEEVILFNPLTRHNSAPPHAGIVPDRLLPAGVVDHFAPIDDCLHRVMSLRISQNENPFSVSPNTSSSTDDKPFTAQTPFSDDLVAFSFSQTSMSGGPPSLSGWVFNGGTSNSEREKKLSTNSKQVLIPIQEIASIRRDLSTGTTTSYSNIADYTSPYSAPVPSAPLLPEAAFWFRGNTSNFTQSRTSDSANRKDNFASGSQGYSYWTATQNIPSFSSCMTGFVGGYLPLGAMTSSEWLRQYRENLNIRQADRLVGPLPIGLPATFPNLNNHDASRSGVFDRFGTPVPSESTIYFERPPLTSSFPDTCGEVRTDNLYNCQRSTPYQFADVQDPRGGQLQLLQHLKEKEWQLQRGPQQMGGPAYM